MDRTKLKEHLGTDGKWHMFLRYMRFKMLCGC